LNGAIARFGTKHVASFLARELREAEANYLVVQIAFGDLSTDETIRSLELFVDEVMPALS
jgi:hypothetical protein